MNTLRILYHIMRADFFERARRYSFLITIGLTIYIAYVYLPPSYSGYLCFSLGDIRGVYNSAWIGTMTTLLMGEFFLLFSFYLLKGSVERDRLTGVGQILAATPITKIKYTLGKWLGNVAVASTMTLAIIAASALLQLLRAEDTHINLWLLASPFLIVLFPALTVIAAAAILFDCIPLLRGGIGNVLFFFIAYPILSLSLDLQGNTLLYPSIYQACAVQFDNCNPTRQIDAGLPPLSDFLAFTYDVVTWLPSILISRFAILFVGALIAILAAWFFHRFDPTKADKSFLWIPSLKRTPIPQTESNAPALTLPPKQTRLSLLAPASRPSTFSTLMNLFSAELRLTFKGTRWLWYLFALGILIAQTLTPLDVAQLYILPLAFIIPLTFWSNLGVRESKHRTEQIIISAPHPLTRQLPITWFTGVFIAILITSPILLRLIFTSQWSNVSGLVAGILFVPSLALTFGIWSNGSKLFEGGYLFLWYIASMYNLPALDFMGRVSVARETETPLFYLLVTLLLMAFAYLGRRRQAMK